MKKEPVLAAHRWSSNAHLIKDCARLGYLKYEDLVADVTYGDGVWWHEWRPRHLAVHDLAIDGIDFRNLPENDGIFDCVAFDPPYVSVGGRSTSKIKEFYRQYGLMDAPTSPALLQAMNDDGLTEVYRVLCHKGYALVKTMDYISSGKLWLGVHKTIDHALSLGFSVADIFHMVGDARMQPARTRKPLIEGGPRVKSRQQHARRNVSTLLVLQKGKVRATVGSRRSGS